MGAVGALALLIAAGLAYVKLRANSVMPWTMYTHMREGDLGAIYEYPRTVKPVEVKPAPLIPKTRFVANR